MADEIDEIRARIDIVDLVGQRVQLKKAGKNYQGLCPFHDDKRPSFSVSPLVGRYKCWSCGEAGDIFTWVQKTQNVDFPEALRILADRAGVTLSKKPTGPSRSERAQHLEIMEFALRFFRDWLSKSTVALEYLDRRGIEKAAVDEWELGYAPDVGDVLAQQLRKQSYSLALCRSLFLVEEDSSGGYYDKFRGRLMFPIRDERGDLVAFGGRLLGDGVPKYINSSDTPLYRKSRVLYGLNRAANSIAKSKPRQVVLCEGYLDVIACHRAGVKGAVASLGTALAEDGAKLLGRWCDEVVILYDADAAGQKAAERAIEVLKPEVKEIRVALMPPGEDPDTLLRNKGPLAIENAVAQATRPIDFKLDQLVLQHPGEKGQEFWDAAADIIAEASNIPEMERHIERLIGRYAGVQDQKYTRESVRDQILARRKIIRRGEIRAPAQPTPDARYVISDLQPAEATLLAALVQRPLRATAHAALVLPELFISETGRAFSSSYAKVFPDHAPEGEPNVWIGKLDEAMHDLILQCTSDGRYGRLEIQYVQDTIKKLEKLLEKRRLQLIKMQTDPDRISKVMETLERLRPDRDARGNSDQKG